MKSYDGWRCVDCGSRFWDDDGDEMIRTDRGPICWDCQEMTVEVVAPETITRYREMAA